MQNIIVVLCPLQCNPSVWNIRPATDNVFQAAAFSVRYLLELRLRLIEKMLGDFVNGVDIYLGVLRDASDSHLARLQVMTVWISYVELIRVNRLSLS